MNQINLEQEFRVALYTKKIRYFNKIQTKKYLIVILKKMMVKDNTIKFFIKKSMN
uniref:Uncharacterized protein ycf18 n=1 Tax=Melanothamnus harveyi TaxID=397005 RepID=A0A1Z1MHV2_MELHR|nr:phycobilisome degradation protein [Melanothamnus harveyi]ARW65459.1 phycobilisome degradation protein [Melanothamnus harveyi]